MGDVAVAHSAVQRDGNADVGGAPPRAELVSSGPEGNALVEEVTAAAATLRRLLQHAALFPDRGAALKATVDRVEERLSRRQLSVVVIGKRSVGKTTFLDALIGDRRIGQARANSLVLTLIRRSKEAGYRALFDDGRMEEFSRHVPDHAAELEEWLREAEQRSQETEQACASAARLLRGIQKQRVQAEANLRGGFEHLETLRDLATRSGQSAWEAEQRAERAQTSLVTVERALPATLRSAPPWWAFWLWLVRTLVLLSHLGNVWRHARNRRQRDKALREKIGFEEQASSAAEGCTQAEAALEPLAAEVERLRAEIVRARKEFPELKRQRATRRKALEQARAGLERHRAERLERYYTEIRALSDPRGRGRHVVELTIEYPARLLPDDVTIIDAPAVTSGAAAQMDRAFDVIHERADGCILLAELDRGVGGTTVRVLERLKDVVPHLLLVLTKMDRAYVGAHGRAQGDAWEQVEQARRIGTRRFAREIGRSPDTVLSMAVAAQAALDDETSGLARRFTEEVEKLFQLLRRERALILGTRSAGAVRELVSQLGEAKSRATQAYQGRIAALEAKRLPEPEEFRRQALTAAASDISAAVMSATHAADRAARELLSGTQAECKTYYQQLTKHGDLAEAAMHCEQAIMNGALEARTRAHAELEAIIERSTRELEAGVLEQLRSRYRLSRDVRLTPSLPVEDPQAIELAPRSVSLAPAVRTRVAANRRLRFKLGTAGALGLAVVGFFAAGVLGLLAGAALGSLLALTPTRAGLVRSAIDDLDRAIASAALALSDTLVGQRPELEARIRSALEASLDNAIARLATSIAEPVAAERRAIESERQHLAELDQLATALEAHDARLGELMEAARHASVGLCR